MVLVVAVGWSTGIAVGLLHPISALVAMVGAGGGAVATVLAPSTRQRLAGLALVAFLLGTSRVDVSRDGLTGDPLVPYAGEVTLSGRVVETPLPRGGRFEAVVEVDSVAGPETPPQQVPLVDPLPRVLLRVTYLRAVYGDRIETRGRLSRPRSRPGWPLEEILARRQIRWVVDAGGVRVIQPAGATAAGTLGAIRGVFEANTRAILPEPHASLVAGIVFGARVGLPAELRQAMSATGTSHLTAVSGANVAMVAGTFVFVANGLVGRLPASLAAIVGVWLYTLLVGAPPSALRAATMATFALAAHGLGRQSDAIVGLALAVAALLAWDPGLALDLGFQLSVAATAGLILLSPSIERWMGFVPVWLRGHVAVAVAAQIATLPLIVGTFQRLPLVSLPANVLAAPTIVPIMGLGALIAVLGPVPGIDAMLGWSAWLFTSVLLTIIQSAAEVPGGVVAVGRAPAWLPVGWYAVIACWVAAGSADVKALGVQPGALKSAAWIGAGLMAMLAVFGWPGSARPEGTQVVLLDTEPAAAFVRTTSGQSALVMTSTESRGIGASVGAHLDLSETRIGVEIGPSGVRTAVDLLEIGRVRTWTDERGTWVSESNHDDDGAGKPPPDGGRSSWTQVGPGDRVDLGDGVVVQVVDVRFAGDQPVADLTILVEGAAVLLPGPGSPSERWGDVAPGAVLVAVLPSSAVSWARTLPPRNWLLLVGEPARERARGASGIPFLSRREYGEIEVNVHHGIVGVEAERCQGGRACAVELPPPTIRSLLPSGPAGTDGSPVQSGQSGDGSRSSPYRRGQDRHTVTEWASE